MKTKINLSKLWRDIKKSVSGNDHDFTKGNIGRAILLLSIPMVLEMVMESVFAVADIFFVSKLGADAVASVGITESLMTIVYALGIGLSTGTAALISRRIGEKKPEEAASVAANSIIIALIISSVISITGLFFSDKLLILMGASEGVIEIGGDFTKIMLSTNFVITLLFVINAVFRNAGDAAISMRVLWIANIINIVLDPLLIFGYGPFPELGVKGAAVATSIGRGFAVIYQLYLLFKGENRIKIHWYNFKIKTELLLKIIKLSLGGIFQNLIATSSWIFLVSIIASFGSVVVAGYTIALRILLFAILPSWGMSNAASTLTGQNLGANQPLRAEKSVWITAFVNMAFLSLVAIVLISFSRNFVTFFIDDIDVIANGSNGLKYISFSLFAYSIGMVMVQALNGSGKTQIPTLINLFCFWIVEIPLAYFLATKTGLEEKGVYIAIITGDLLLTLIGIFIFRRGKWKLSKV
jgi:putative MATE family efflux protein